MFRGQVSSSRSHSTVHLEDEKQSCLGAKLVALLILNYEIVMNAKSIILDTFNKNNEQRRNPPDICLAWRGPHDLQF